MLDLLQVPRNLPISAPPAREAQPTPPTAAAMAHCLALMLDQIDFGMLLLAGKSHLLHANHVARDELDASHPLQLLDRQLRARDVEAAPELHEALDDASRRGLRRLLTLGHGEHRITLAVVPLAGAANDEASGMTLVVFGRRSMCPTLTAHWFGRAHGLTPAEQRVLALLCQGLTPSAAARAQGVLLSTVRSQISGIRTKTGSRSLRDLVRQVAMLPPLVSALRGTTLLQ
jgi:DNA-binding CsgD family transcriptional regulator